MTRVTTYQMISYTIRLNTGWSNYNNSKFYLNTWKFFAPPRG